MTDQTIKATWTITAEQLVVEDLAMIVEDDIVRLLKDSIDNQILNRVYDQMYAEFTNMTAENRIAFLGSIISACFDEEGNYIYVSTSKYLNLDKLYQEALKQTDDSGYTVLLFDGTRQLTETGKQLWTLHHL